MSEHSKYFSPSGAKTWMTCRGSAILNANKSYTTNKHAERGTALHAFCEKNFYEDVVDYTTVPSADQEDVSNALENAREFQNTLTDPQTYLELKAEVAGMPGLFGTIDLVMYSEFDSQLAILDYKFGYTQVDPETSQQLRIYALAVLSTLKIGHVDTITLGILQPQQSRRPILHTMTMSDLRAWRAEELVPAYETIDALAQVHSIPPIEMFNPGEDQCRWCKSKLDCPALQAEVEVKPIEGGNIFDLLERVKLVRLWANDVEAQAMALLESGVTDPRWKIVRGRANRKWKDPEEAAKWLAGRGFKKEERYNYTVIGIPAAEALIKGLTLSTKLENSFAKLIEKPEGSLTYAPANDKRPGVVINISDDAALFEDAELNEL